MPLAFDAGVAFARSYHRRLTGITLILAVGCVFGIGFAAGHGQARAASLRPKGKSRRPRLRRWLQSLTPNGPTVLVPVDSVTAGTHVMTPPFFAPRFLNRIGFRGFARHHGVVAREGPNKVVIGKGGNGRVEAHLLEGDPEVPYVTNGLVRVREHKATRPVAIIEREALALRGTQLHYDILNNCEHLVEKLITGKPKSRQLRFYNAILAGTPRLWGFPTVRAAARRATAALKKTMQLAKRIAAGIDTGKKNVFGTPPLTTAPEQ